MFIFNSKKIESRMEYLGITKGELAENLNVSPATITKITQNQLQSANFEILYKLHKTLGLSIEQIIIDDEKEDKTQPYTIDNLLIEIHELSELLNSKIQEYSLFKRRNNNY